MKLVLIGNAKGGGENIAGSLADAGFSVGINEPLSVEVPMVFFLSSGDGNDLRTTFKPLRKAAGQQCRPLAILLSDVDPEWEPELFEMVEHEMRSLLESVTSRAVADGVPFVRTDDPQWIRRVAELASSPVRSATLLPPDKKLLKKRGLKHLLEKK